MWSEPYFNGGLTCGLIMRKSVLILIFGKRVLRPEGMWMKAETQYLERDGVRLAYQVFGSQPRDLILVPSRLEYRFV